MNFYNGYKIIAFLSLFITIIICAPSQAQAQYHFNDIQLSWRDFIKKNVPISSNAAAQTAVELIITSSVENDKLLIVIELIQDRDKSWVSRQFLQRATDTESRNLLNHEKLHYAINLIGLKMLYNTLSDFTFSKDYKSELAGIFNSINRVTTKSNSDYDRQTTHGIKKEAQEIWTEDIFQQLNDLYPNEEKLTTTYTLLKTIH